MATPIGNIRIAVARIALPRTRDDAQARRVSKGAELQLIAPPALGGNGEAVRLEIGCRGSWGLAPAMDHGEFTPDSRRPEQASQIV